MIAPVPTAIFSDQAAPSVRVDCEMIVLGGKRHRLSAIVNLRLPEIGGSLRITGTTLTGLNGRYIGEKGNASPPHESDALFSRGDGKEVTWFDLRFVDRDYHNATLSIARIDAQDFKKPSLIAGGVCTMKEV